METGVATALYAGLRSGAVDRLTEFAWPASAGDAPGGWVEAGVDAPPDAVRGFALEELPWGLDDELWRIELRGELAPERRRWRATRGRLLGRVEAWTPEAAAALVEACAHRVRDAAVAGLRTEGREAEAGELAGVHELAALEATGNRLAGSGESPGARLAGYAADVVLYARDASRPAGGASVAGYVAAHALAGADATVSTYEPRFEAERRWQVEWLRRRLQL